MLKLLDLLLGRKRDEYAHMRPIQVEIPTLEVIRHPDLIAGINDLSTMVSNMDEVSIIWEFETMSAALKACFLVQGASGEGQLMSHRLLCAGVSRMQHGKFLN